MVRHLYHFHGISLKGELSELYINLAIRGFSLSMIAVFIPIYLLNIGYTLNQVLIYNLIYYLIAGACAIPVALLSSTWGIKHTVVTSIPLMLLQLSLLYSLDLYNFSLYLIAVLGGISMILYWIPVNTDFAKNSDKKHRGKQTSFLNVVSSASQLVGPVAGAFVLKYAGFHFLFLIVLLLLIISVIPLFWTKDTRDKSDLRLKIIFSKKHLKYLAKFMGQGTYLIAEGIIWPLFIFLFIHDTMNVGIAATLKGVGIIFFAVLMGRLSDLKYRKILIKLGAFMYSLLWVLRQFFQSPWHIFTFSFLGGLLMTMIKIPFFAKVSDHANKEDILEFMTFREVALSLGRIIFITILILVVYKFTIAFHIAAISSFPFLLW